MKHSLISCALSVAFGLAACSSGGSGGAGASPGVPSEAYEAAKAQILDVSFKNCGDFWGSVYTKDPNALDFTAAKEYQFKNLQLHVETFSLPLTDADKLNGLQWRGQISLSADATRERPIGGKDWSPWSNGFGAAFNRILMEQVNGKIKLDGGTALRAACPQ
jgi:hypothetical protein